MNRQALFYLLFFWLKFICFYFYYFYFLLLRRQVDRDCEFLEQERIMDYSLLVGLHFVEAQNDDSTPSGTLTPVSNFQGFSLLAS